MGIPYFKLYSLNSCYVRVCKKSPLSFIATVLARCEASK